MDYIKRKKEQAYILATAAYMNGFLDHQIKGKVSVDWRKGVEERLCKILDEVYKRGLKDGAKKV